MSSPLDRIEAAVLDAMDAGGDFRYDPVGKAGLAALEALVNVAKAAEAVVNSWGNPGDEAYPSRTYANGGDYISLQHLIALREALAVLDEKAGGE